MHGFVHPDQWFQGFEVASAWLHQELPALVPWEFANCVRPSRSFVAAGLTSGPPALLRSAWAAPAALAWAACWTLASCLAAVRIVSAAFGAPAGRTLAILASTCWPLLVLGSRPLSNTVEAALLMLTWTLLQAVRATPPAASPLRCAALCSSLAAVVTLGLFVRFTFAAFAAPVVWAFLAHATGAGRPWKGRSFASCAMQLGAAGVGVVAAACACVLVDSLANGAAVLVMTPALSLSWTRWPPPLAPLHSLVYNLQPSNLALHGSHHRATHVSVGMTTLYGPAWAALLAAGLAGGWEAAKAGREDGPWAPILTLHASGPPRAHLLALSAATLATGLGALSTAPHQEPRFLLPLALPVLTLLTALLHITGKGGAGRVADALRSRPRTSSSIWLLFNAALALFFGVLHQGGILPAAVALSELSRTGTLPGLRPDVLEGCDALHSVWFGTYPPPRTVLGRGGRVAVGGEGRGSWAAPWCGPPSHPPPLRAADGALEVAGRGGTGPGPVQRAHEVRSTAPGELAAAIRATQGQQSCGPSHRILVVAPVSLRTAVAAAAGGEAAVEARVSLSCTHVSTEAWPRTWAEVGLEGTLLRAANCSGGVGMR
jgi:phosphatidylinositol glycan class Z